MMITGFGIVTAIGLMLFFDRTRLGRATTAVVDDPQLLSLAKTNPDAVRRLSWMVGSSFAAISGMLLAPKLGVSIGVLVLIVIAAYGAAAVGLFQNLTWTLLGAFAIGVLINYSPRWFDDTDSYFLKSIPRNIPFLVLLLIFLLVPARHLTERGVRNVRTLTPPRELPRSWNATGLAVLLGAAILVPHVVADYNITVYAAALGFAIIFLSLGMLIWTSGQISLCHMGFAALGATTAGKLTTVGLWDWIPVVGGKQASWPVAVLLGGLIVVPLGADRGHPGHPARRHLRCRRDLRLRHPAAAELLPRPGHVRQRRPGAEPAAGRRLHPADHSPPTGHDRRASRRDLRGQLQQRQALLLPGA